MPAMIDSTYQSVVARLPPDAREAASGLLFALGLARAPHTGWAGVFQLPPSRDLPLFAPPAGTPQDEPGLGAFRRAHHCACFHHVLMDRMADRQADITPERERLASHFLASWRHSLAEATGNAEAATLAIDRSVEDWRRGVEQEREARAREAFTLEDYGHGVLLKLGWAALASESLLHQWEETSRLRHFRSAFCLLALGMQCVDDAEDSAEDEARDGRSVPGALGFPPPAFFSAGAHLTRSAASVAREGGFAHFATWLSLRADELEGIRQRRVLPADKLAGLVIASSLEAICGNVDTTCFASST